MEKLFTKKGILHISIGRGWIARRELSELQPGTTIKSTKMAGEPADAFYNGCYLTSGQIVVMDGLLGFRISGKLDYQNPPLSPEESHNPTELLATEIRIAELPFSLKELENLSVQSIIALDKKLDPSNNITLHVNGIPAADGQLCITREFFAVRISSILMDLSGGEHVATRSSGFIIRKPDAVKTYDLTRPDKFTLRNILNMERIHASFVQQCNIISPEDNRTFADQLTMEEFLPSIANGYTLVVARVNSPGSMREDEPTPDHPVKLLLERQDPELPVPDSIIQFVKMMATTREVKSPGIIFCIRNDSRYATLAEKQNIEEILFPALRTSWSTTAALPLKLECTGRDPALAKIIPERDMILYTSSAPADSKPEILIIYPFITLEPYLSIMK